MFKATGAFEFFPGFKIVIDGVELQIEIGDAIVKLHSAQLGTSTVSTLKPSLQGSSFPPKKKKKKKKKKKPTVIGKSKPAWAGCDRKIAARSATALIGYGHGNG